VKVALVHDWLTGMRGGEKCLEVLCELYPDADLFTLVHIPGTVSEIIEDRRIVTSFIQKLPMVRSRYRSYLPFFPAAIERLNVGDYDLVLSTSHCVAKGVIPREDALHLCYCHTPMRYVWDMYDAYFGPGRISGPARLIIPGVAEKLRKWDVATVERVDHFAANSRHVQKRIERIYQRGSEVIYPPVDTAHTMLSEKPGEYFLIVSAFAPYKRIDLAVEAFNRMGEKLLIIGTGQDEKKLKKAAGSNITFSGWADASELGRYYADCRALIFPGEEDFGIVPVEAQCYGKPVIAYGRGGALETVLGIQGSDSSGFSKAITGVFFKQQTVDDLVQAVRRFKETEFDAAAIRRHALTFDRMIYKEKMKSFINQKINEWEKFHAL